MHQIPQPILLLLLLPLCLIACHTGNGSATVTGNAAAPLRSPRYHADSLRFLAATEPLYDQRRERETIPYLDSIFLLPASLNPDAPQHSDTLSTAEGRLLCNRALRYLMVSYNLLIDFEGGYRHLDSLQRLHLPFLERYCLRGLLTAKAQMLMPLDRHAEALQCLDQAMKLSRTEDSIAATLPSGLLARTQATGRLECPENDSYWSAAAGITYMGVDSASTRAEQAFLRVIDIARRTGFRGGLYPHAIARLADIYLHQGKYEQSIALCRQAIASTPSDKPDEQGQYIAAENLTEAYRRLGLYDEALRYCAIVTDAPKDFEILNNLRGRSYINKAAVLAEMNRSADALVALQQADSCFNRTGNDYYKLQAALERAHLLTLQPDSLEAGLRIFTTLEGQIPAHRQAFYLYYYGSACAQAGQYSRAIPLLESAVTESENISERLMAHQAARLLTECYRHTGRLALLADFLPRYQALSDSIASDAKIRQLAAANIRFETEKKEQEPRPHRRSSTEGQSPAHHPPRWHTLPAAGCRHHRLGSDETSCHPHPAGSRRHPAARTGNATAQPHPRPPTTQRPQSRPGPPTLRHPGHTRKHLQPRQHHGEPATKPFQQRRRRTLPPKLLRRLSHSTESSAEPLPRPDLQRRTLLHARHAATGQLRNGTHLGYQQIQCLENTIPDTHKTGIAGRSRCRH